LRETFWIAEEASASPFADFQPVGNIALLYDLHISAAGERHITITFPLTFPGA
jgi:hypothetical protein